MINEDIKIGAEGYLYYKNLNSLTSQEWEKIPFITDFKFSEIYKTGKIYIGFKNSKNKYYNIFNDKCSLKLSIMSGNNDENCVDESLIIQNVQFKNKTLILGDSNGEDLISYVYQFECDEYYWE